MRSIYSLDHFEKQKHRMRGFRGTVPLNVNTYTKPSLKRMVLMHRLPDPRNRRALRNSLVVPRNLDYNECGAFRQRESF